MFKKRTNLCKKIVYLLKEIEKNVKSEMGERDRKTEGKRGND